MTEPQPNNVGSLQVSAPGKLVLWGEYAVLAGAEAGVMAVDRFATCQFVPNSTANTTTNNTTDGAWQLTTTGFTSKPTNLDAAWFASEQAPEPDHPAALLWHAARANHWQPVDGAHIHIDSSAFYQYPGNRLGASEVPQPVKLGLGSSAAVCTALTHLCAELSGELSGEISAEASDDKSISTINIPIFTKALAAHRAAQQGAGSGIDIAASTLGGLLGYKLNAAEPAIRSISWPKKLHWQAFWTGSSASTTEHLKRFDAWRAQGNTNALTQLVEASNQCSERFDLTTLEQYVAALRRFDADSQIGIYAKGHGNLHKLASDNGVTYKPCGAGGGDLGIAFAADPAQLQIFAAAAETTNIVQIRLEMANHGVTTQAGNHQPNP